MVERKALESMFKEHRYRNFKWIDPAHIHVSHWVRLKCMYGCKDYGRNPTCPPNTPSVSECEGFFREYTTAVVFRFSKSFKDPNDRYDWTRKVNLGLLRLEREVFISGYEKAFLLFMDPCNLCNPCVGTDSECKNQKAARPTPEALAVNVFSTVRKYGFPIEVLSDFSQAMNRYAFLLVE